MKIHCLNPAHTDDTPSMEIYSNGGHCFVCGYNSSLEEVTNEVPIEEFEKIKKKEPENIEDKIRDIQSLTKRNIRGLNFHTDNFGYYLVWPDKTYYKKRLFSGTPRYIGPSGHRSPLLRLGSDSKVLAIVEGEINALSLQEALKDYRVTIVSPGSANELLRHMNEYLTIGAILAIVFVDRDPAGVVNGLELKRELLKHGKRVVLVALERDFNQILQEDGIKAVQEIFKKEVGLFRGL